MPNCNQFIINSALIFSALSCLLRRTSDDLLPAKPLWFRVLNIQHCGNATLPLPLPYTFFSRPQLPCPATSHLQPPQTSPPDFPHLVYHQTTAPVMCPLQQRPQTRKSMNKTYPNLPATCWRDTLPLYCQSVYNRFLLNTMQVG